MPRFAPHAALRAPCRASRGPGRVSRRPGPRKPGPYVDHRRRSGARPFDGVGNALQYSYMQEPELQVFKAEFFRALAHPLRIRVLETLVAGERSVQELQEILGAEQPIVSQQLAILRSKNIVVARKEGNNVRYSVRDPLLGDLLKVARRIFNNQLIGTQNLLRELKRETRRR
jgi:DNA-binding transcriptional ArsR family regulator